MTTQTYELQELADRIVKGAELSQEERHLVARLLTLSETVEPALIMARQHDAVVQLNGFRLGESSEEGHVPLFAIVALHEPDPETWRVLQLVLDEDTSIDLRGHARKARTALDILSGDITLNGESTLDDAAQHLDALLRLLPAE